MSAELDFSLSWGNETYHLLESPSAYKAFIATCIIFHNDELIDFISFVYECYQKITNNGQNVVDIVEQQIRKWLNFNNSSLHFNAGSESASDFNLSEKAIEKIKNCFKNDSAAGSEAGKTDANTSQNSLNLAINALNIMFDETIRSTLGATSQQMDFFVGLIEIIKAYDKFFNEFYHTNDNRKALKKTIQTHVFNIELPFLGGIKNKQITIKNLPSIIGVIDPDNRKLLLLFLCSICLPVDQARKAKCVSLTHRQFTTLFFSKGQEEYAKDPTAAKQGPEFLQSQIKNSNVVKALIDYCNGLYVKGTNYGNLFNSAYQLLQQLITEEKTQENSTSVTFKR